MLLPTVESRKEGITTAAGGGGDAVSTDVVPARSPANEGSNAVSLKGATLRLFH
jgi:hypothetical protein